MKTTLYNYLSADECKAAKAANVRNVTLGNVTIDEMKDLCAVIADETMNRILSDFTNHLQTRYNENQN